MHGCEINKAEEALRFGVSEKSIQRDIEGIRTFLDTQAATDGIPNTLIYDYKKKVYRIQESDDVKFSNDEIIAICKILLTSRAFSKKEMNSMLDKLVEFCVPEKNKKRVSDILRNERFHYGELTHKQKILDKMLVLANAINSQFIIEFDYKGGQAHSLHHRHVEPLAIMFDQFYFYLAARIFNVDDETSFMKPQDTWPTIYRIDRIKHMNVTEEHFAVPYKDKFEEGESRKRIQFMRGGKLRKVKFVYSGYAVEAVLDRLPTSKILSEDKEKYTIETEVFGDGIYMWLRSQGDIVTIIP